MVSLTKQDIKLIVQTVQVCSSRNVFKLPEYTHVKNVYDYFASLLSSSKTGDDVDLQPVADVCKLIETISERGGFCLPEFETIHRLYQRLTALKPFTFVESAATPAPSTSP